MKSYTDLEQSKKLAKILPLESADMEWINGDGLGEPFPFVGRTNDDEGLVCWSLAALLSVLPKGYSLGRKTNGKYYVCMTYVKHDVTEYDEPIDACYNLILELHELNLL